MIVRCTSAVRPDGESQSDNWFSVGNDYTVIGLFAEGGKGITFRIVSDDHGTPILVAAEMFEVVQGLLPHNWVASGGANGRLVLQPAAWSEPGFWEGYFDGRLEAEAIFDRELAVIEASGT